MDDNTLNAIGLVGLAGIGGGMDYLYAGLFSINPLLGVALGAMTFVGLPLTAKNGS